MSRNRELATLHFCPAGSDGWCGRIAIVASMRALLVVAFGFLLFAGGLGSSYCRWLRADIDRFA